MRRSAKERTNEEIQLLGVLDHIRDDSRSTALTPALRQRMADRLSIPRESIPSDDFFLSDFMQHALAELMGRALGTKGGNKALTGFVIIQLRYFDFLHRGCSINKVLDAFEDPHVDESVFELLQEHSLMVDQKMTIGSPKMLHLSWLKSTSPKTAGRYAESAMKSIIGLLGDYLSELFELTSSIPEPVSIVAIKTSEDAIDLPMLIRKYSTATCSLSSSAYGIQMPIAECVGRSVHAKREPCAIKSEHLPNYLANGIGTIGGLPGSGRSVLLQSIALQGNQKNLYACYYFMFSLSTFLEKIKQGYSLPQFIVSKLIAGMSCSDEQRLQLVAKVDELIAARRLVLLADDLERLNRTSQELVITKLASATSVYFTVTPWMVDDVHDLLRRNEYAANRVMLILDNIDSQTREAIARVAATYMNIPYADDSIQAEFDPCYGIEGTTALGILAALKTISVPAYTKHLYFGYLLLQETLPRSGYPRLDLPPYPDELDVTAIWLLRVRRSAREEMMRYEPYQLHDQVRDIRQAVPLYANSLTHLLGEPLQRLLAMRVLMHWPYHPAVEFIFPAIEELLMMLDDYYFGYPTSFLEFLFRGNKSPVLQRVCESMAYVSQLLGF